MQPNKNIFSTISKYIQIDTSMITIVYIVDMKKEKWRTLIHLSCPHLIQHPFKSLET